MDGRSVGEGPESGGATRTPDEGAQTPVDALSPSKGIPIEVLDLSARPYNALRRCQIYTVEELVCLSEQDLLRIRGMGKGSIEQIRSALSRVGLSLGRPILMTEALLEALDRFRERFGSEQLMFDLAEPSLENLVTWWFSDLSEEQIHVLTLRYGIQGDPVPVEEIARLMGNTPRKVVAIEARALQKVRQRRHRLFLDPIAESLRREIYRRGGLVTESDLASALQNLYPSEEICPIGVARLVMHVYDDFARIPGEDAWGLVGYPLSLVPIVRSFLGGIGAESAEPIAFERLWRQMRQYREQLAEPLPDDFLRACIQTDRRIEIARDGLCWVHADEEAPQPSWKEPSLDLLVEAWLGSQSDRHRQVIWSRYGLGDGRERTLEECGQIMGVTRERVRQIQRRCLRDLTHPSRISVVSGIVDALYKWMRSAGGLLTEEEAGRYLASVYPAEHIHPVAVGRLLLSICPRFKAVIKDHLWGLPVVPLALVLDVQGEMVRILERVSLPLSPGQLVARFKETAIYRRNRRSLDDGFVAACLRTHPEIARDEDNRCVLRKWSRKRLDEIVQALHEIGRPAHFTVVTERANMLLPPEQRALAQTVRAYMERRTDLFVSLGRGIYWLRDHVAHATADETNPPGGNLALRFDTLARWQIEFDGGRNDVGHDTHKEVEKIRRLGLDFFSK